MSFNALDGVQIKTSKLTLNGFSISGLATWMTVQELSLCFDMGECPLSAVPMDHVFLTHAHGDHSRCLMRHHALRKMLGIEKEATYYIPEIILEETKAWIRASAVFEGVKGNIKLPHLVPLRSDMRSSAPLTLAHRKHNSVKAFKADHGIPSLGYTIYESRQKLKPEYHGRIGRELAELKRNGVQIEMALHVPLITFIGDCTAETLWREEEIWESPVLVIESTYIAQGEQYFAHERGHTHLAEIGDLLQQRDVACEAIVLKHFSMKIKAYEALEAALKYIPHSYHDRVFLLLDLPKTPSGLSLAELAWRDL